MIGDTYDDEIKQDVTVNILIERIMFNELIFLEVNTYEIHHSSIISHTHGS